jgi:tagatose 1,6-diphosphate aldolase GatY/KbaY
LLKPSLTVGLLHQTCTGIRQNSKLTHHAEGRKELRCPGCPSRPLLDDATRAGKAVAALNFYNAETLLAHTRAANALNASIILQTTEATINYLGLRMIVAMASAAADEMEQPVALHLDHGSTYDLAARCIEHGYTSVMIDGSKLSFDDNCALTRRVRPWRMRPASPSKANWATLDKTMKRPQATGRNSSPLRTMPRFVSETKVDALAVAVGTAHGFYKGAVEIDFDRLKEIHAALLNTPLVLHGGSGVSAELLQQGYRVRHSQSELWN